MKMPGMLVISVAPLAYCSCQMTMRFVGRAGRAQPADAPTRKRAGEAFFLLGARVTVEYHRRWACFPSEAANAGQESAVLHESQSGSGSCLLFFGSVRPGTR
jgi:hypothetical protein